MPTWTTSYISSLGYSAREWDAMTIRVRYRRLTLRDLLIRVVDSQCQRSQHNTCIRHCGLFKSFCDLFSAVLHLQCSIKIIGLIDAGTSGQSHMSMVIINAPKSFDTTRMRFNRLFFGWTCHLKFWRFLESRLCRQYSDSLSTQIFTWDHCSCMLHSASRSGRQQTKGVLLVLPSSNLGRCPWRQFACTVFSLFLLVRGCLESRQMPSHVESSSDIYNMPHMSSHLLL